MRGQHRRCAQPAVAEADAVECFAHQLGVANAQTGAAGRVAAKGLERAFRVEHGLVVAQRQAGQALHRHRQPQPLQAQPAQWLVGAVQAVGLGIPGRPQHQPQHRCTGGQAVQRQAGRHDGGLLVRQGDGEDQRLERVGAAVGKRVGHCRITLERRGIATRPGQLHGHRLNPAGRAAELQVKGVAGGNGGATGARATIGWQQQAAQGVSVKAGGVAVQAQGQHHRALALGQGQQRRGDGPAQHLGGRGWWVSGRAVGQAAKRFPARLGCVGRLTGCAHLFGVGSGVEVVPDGQAGGIGHTTVAVALGHLQHLGGAGPVGHGGRATSTAQVGLQTGQRRQVGRTHAQRGQALQRGGQVQRLTRGQCQRQHVGQRTGGVGRGGWRCRRRRHRQRQQGITAAAVHRRAVGIGADGPDLLPVGPVGRHAVGQGQAALGHGHDELQALSRHAEVAFDAQQRVVEPVQAFAAGGLPGPGQWAQRGSQHGVDLARLAQCGWQHKQRVAALAGGFNQAGDLRPFGVQHGFGLHHGLEVGQRQAQFSQHKGLHIGPAVQHGVGVVGVGHFGQAVVQAGKLGRCQAQRAAQVGIEIVRRLRLQLEVGVACAAGLLQDGVDARPVGTISRQAAGAQAHQGAQVIQQRHGQAAGDKADDLLGLHQRGPVHRVGRLAGRGGGWQAGQQRQWQRVPRRRAAQGDAQHRQKRGLARAPVKVLTAGLGDAGVAHVHPQRPQLDHLHRAEQCIGRSAVVAVLAGAVFTGTQQGADGQQQVLGACIQRQQHMHLVGHGGLAQHVQHVAVVKIQMAAGQGVGLVAGMAQQLDAGQQQRHLRPGKRRGLLSVKALGRAQVVGGSQQSVTVGQQAGPITLRLVVVIHKHQLGGKGAGKGQQVGAAALVQHGVGRVQLRPLAGGLAGAVGGGGGGGGGRAVSGHLKCP